MQKTTIEFKNPKQFEESLNSYKATLLKDNAYDDLSMYFQIFSTEIKEEVVRPIWEVIETVFPGKPWFGHSTAGNVDDCEVTSDLSISVTLFEKKTTKFKLLHYDMAETDTVDVANKIIEECKNNSWVKAVEFYLTINPESPSVFCENFEVLPEDIQMYGGIVCTRDITSPDSCIFSSVGGFNTKGVIVLLFGGDDFYVKSFKVSGWQPIGRNFVVTKASGCTIYELDGMPAYNVYRKYLNIMNDENLFANALEFPMMYQHNGVTIVRAPAAGNADGSLVMSADVQQGSMVRLSYGEPNTVMQAVQNEAKQLKNFNADQIHIFYCTARKVFWGLDEPTTEIYPFRNVKGSTGFFSHGEFLREKGNLNLNSVTLVIAAMREGDGCDSCDIEAFDEKSINTKLPLAARMATFIREMSFELESINSQLQYYNEQLQEIAVTDSLTGLDNRLAFDKYVKDIENDLDSMTPWKMIMIDLNGLKNTNDNFGHEAGDELLKAAAKVLDDTYGNIGHCFRIGGDEFVVIIDADENEMNTLKHALIDAINSHNENSDYKLSMALGIGYLYTREGVRKSISDWKMQSDLDMYRDKEIFHKAMSRTGLRY